MDPDNDSVGTGEGKEEEGQAIIPSFQAASLYSMALKNREPGAKERRPIKMCAYDVSTLKPLTELDHDNDNDDDFNKMKIELSCKLTGVVHLCFSRIEYAAQALGLTEDEIHQIASSFGKLVIPDHDKLPFCELRYTQQSNAYEYGSHVEDFWMWKNQNHTQTLQRWKRTQEINQKQDKDKNVTTTVGTKKNVVTAILEGSTVWSQIVSPTPSSKWEGNDNHNNKDTKCIACQKTMAEIVFWPCHHCLLCTKCSAMCCPFRCPICMTTITERVQPDEVVWIQPYQHWKTNCKGLFQSHN